MPDNELHDDQEIYATLVEINQEPTELYKILKFEHIVSGGGEAKQIIAEGYVYVNGEVETRKRKKIYSGDLIYFNEQYFQVVLKGTADDYEIVEQVNQSLDKPLEKLETKPSKTKKERKPISF
ncbi:RNA-binding S4 domain-containing protein [Psychromonas sp. PT13]|uniref:RNA-binding S4 domain-containing protein n=1 Tax=Psychromonas sp. PT13 TaxID=3439547 RepID=UPI003EC10C68